MPGNPPNSSSSSRWISFLLHLVLLLLLATGVSDAAVGMVGREGSPGPSTAGIASVVQSAEAKQDASPRQAVSDTATLGPPPASVPQFVPPDGLSNGWYAYIDTSLGQIIIRLLPHQAPQSVAHFAAFADGRLSWFDPVTGEQLEIPYYDGTIVQKAFAARRFEAGERNQDGRLAPLRYVPTEGGGPVNFVQGYKVGMTRASGNRISAVQFFITAASQPFLTPRHPCFGEVVKGKDVVNRITEVKTYDSNRLIEPVVIERIRTFKVGEPDPLPEPEVHIPRPAILELNKDKRRPR